MKGSKQQYVVKPSEASQYFSPSVLVTMTDSVRHHILSGNSEDKKTGQGVFVFPETKTLKGQLGVAVYANWTRTVDKKDFDQFQILKYQLYRGEISNVLLTGGSEGNWTITRMENSEELNEVEVLKRKCWSLVDLLRGKIISSSEYTIALYLLTLYRNEIDLRIYFTPQEGIKLTSVEIVTSQNKLLEIHKVFKLTLEKLGHDDLLELGEFLKSINKSSLQKNFPAVFDYLLYRIIGNQGRAGGEHILPLELCRFACSLVKLPETASIYNPFAGLASFAIFSGGKNYYWGQEINLSTWAIGLMRILAHQKSEVTYFDQEDSIQNWNSYGRDYDLIIANPPFGMRLHAPLEGKFGICRTVEQFFIERGIDDLKSTGKLIAVISNRFLFSSGTDYRLRQYLIENDLIDMVVSFPGGLLPNTNIPISIIVIARSKEEKDIVRFVDAKQFVDEISVRERRLNDFELSSLIANHNESESVRIVSTSAIRKNDYSLVVQRYFEPQAKFDAGTKFETLGDLLVPIHGQRISKILSGKFVRIRDLKEDRLNCHLDLSDVAESDIPKAARTISESCLLVASRWKSLKPTYFTYRGEPIHVIPDTIALRVDESKVNVDYLINELHADYVIEQVQSFKTGEIVPMIRRDDLLKVKIQLPSIEEQRARIKGAKEAYIQSRERQLTLERELFGLKDESFRDFASIKHSFRQYLNALKANVSGTRKFIANNEGKSISVDSVYSTKRRETLGEHLVSLGGTIELMIRLLDTYDEKERSSAIPKKMNLENLVLEAQGRFKNPEVFEFEKLYVDRESFNSEGDIEPLVTILEEDFYQVFSNIVSNAVDHGFTDHSGKKLIRTSLSLDMNSNMCVLEIANNGRPMPASFTFKHLITRGERTTNSKGSGMGGSDIKQLVERNHGKFELKSQPMEEFPVMYVISFPLTRPNDDEV